MIEIKNKDFSVNDQLLMEEAANYNRWLFSLVSSWLNGSVLEIGAGIGNITRHILKESKKVTSLTCLDNNFNCCKMLKHKINQEKKRIDVTIINDDFMDMKNAGNYDCIFSFNVLEHIEDDMGALKKAKELLVPNGKLLCFVPSFQVLYGSMDRKLHHYRRYERKDLSKKLELCGFDVLKVRYYNTLGFFGWFINNKILEISSQKKKQILLFDKYILPLQSFIESYINIPFGQNLFFIACRRM